MVGTLVNTGTVIAGSLIGLAIHSRLPKKVVDIVFQCMGLFTVAIGIHMALASDRLLLAVLSLVVGSVIGQWIDIDGCLRRFSDYLQSKKKNGDEEDASSRFTEGFITSTMLFCVGSMAILGSLQDGMGETPTLLYTKSIMDGISSVILASTFGIAILFSSMPLLLYQGGLTLFAAFISRFMNETMIADMTSVGGIMLIGLGINILKIKEINVTNMLPALVIAVFLSHFWT